MKKVVNLQAADTGGQNYRLKYLFDKYSKDWKMYSSIVNTNYIGYPFDLFWKNDKKKITSLISKADLIHLHKSYKFYGKYLKDNILFHQHDCVSGSPNECAISDKKYNAFRVVSTMNLLPWVDFDVSRWLPAPAPSNLYETLVKKEGKIRICQSPTNREIKDTEFVIKTVNKLKRVHPEVELVLIEGKNWFETMKIKSTCDIGIDQFNLWYGNSSLEYWELGIPSLCGMDNKTRDASIEYFGYEPWCFITKENFYKTLDDLVCDASLRKKYGDIGKKHLLDFHSDENVVNKTENLYDRTINLCKHKREIKVNEKLNILFVGGKKSIHVLNWIKYFEKKHNVVLVSNLNEAFKVMKIFKPDLIHGHYFFNYGYDAAAIGGIPTIISAWGSDLALSNKKTPKLKYIFDRADIIHVHDIPSKNRAIELGCDEKKIVVQAWGIDLNLFKKDNNKNNEFIVLNGRSLNIRKYKVDVFIKSMPYVLSKFPNIKFMLTASGKDYDNLLRLSEKLKVDKNLIMLNGVDNIRFPEYLSSSDIYVDTYFPDSMKAGGGIGITNMEAMACSLPMILAERPSVVGEGSEWFSGLSYNGSNPKDLANKILYYIENENERCLKANNSRILAEKYCDIKINMNKIEEVYYSIAKKFSSSISKEKSFKSIKRNNKTQSLKAIQILSKNKKFNKMPKKPVKVSVSSSKPKSKEFVKTDKGGRRIYSASDLIRRHKL